MTGERLDRIATATAGDGGWVDLIEPIMARAGDGFVAVPEEGNMTDALDRVVQLVGETRMDARPGDRRADLVGGCQILYPVILVSIGFVFVQSFRKRLPWRVALPFAVNLVSNLIFTPIQFGMRNLPLAAVDILVVWATNIWTVVAVWRHYRWVAVAQGPYFVWVSLATVLQLSVTAMNWGR